MKISGVTPTKVRGALATVVIHGVDPTRVESVQFGGVHATNVHRNTHGQLACLTPCHVDGDVTVKVTATDGEECEFDGRFTYGAPDVDDRTQADE